MQMGQQLDPNSPDVVIGEDWEKDVELSNELKDSRLRRGLWAFRKSPLTRKIVTFNLIALNILIIGVLFLNSSRDNLVQQRARAMLNEAKLVGNVVSVLHAGGQDLIQSPMLGAAMTDLPLRKGEQVYIFDANRSVVTTMVGRADITADGLLDQSQPLTPITNTLEMIWSFVIDLSGVTTGAGEKTDPIDVIVMSIDPVLSGKSRIEEFSPAVGQSEFLAMAPIQLDGTVIGIVALRSATGEMNALVKVERERVLQLLLIGTIVSIALSLVLASTISNPLSDLATAAELGRHKNSNRVSPGRIRIPDLSARPDEIGRLSSALRGMVAALYERIETNEQFAADVAHEIKNPLASLRSAVGTLRVAKRDDQREKLLDVIEHDVRRLDRLVSDISNASRLDSELVKETQEEFDLLRLVENLTAYLGADAESKGVDFITDLPDAPVLIHGLEARLAQVFVNLITNAISFCEEGDAIRVWIRTRENRVLVVVEDTGPGIPEGALGKVFNRFYSERPTNDFGNNSGLGLAISKQIVEAHDGAIWAENIRPTQMDATSAPLGARFVVGLPL
jgi:two-component system sensor histidine kinase ChvG